MRVHCHRRKTPPVKLVGERSNGTLPENQNVRVPNKRERVVEVVTDDEGQKRWKSVDRDGWLR